jgi:H/ACA ribonucleoprotein complex subunit 4
MKPEKGTNRSVILIDKPPGLTSFETVELVSKILGVKKAGHSGTLDPNATGLLLIALAEARKAMPVLTGLDKEYVGVMRLHGDVADSDLEKALKSFKGEITQVPPVKSAVARKPRKRVVHEMELLGRRGRDVKFRVLCEAGTYIRKIAHDAGQSLGCGAHLVELRRTRVGPFSIENAVTVSELERMPESEVSKVQIGLEHALDMIKLPRIVIKNEYEPQIRNGSPARKDFVKAIPKNIKEGDYAGVFREDGKIISLSRFIGRVGTVAKTDRVFLD